MRKRKWLAILTVLMLLFCMTACGKKQTVPDPVDGPGSQQQGPDQTSPSGGGSAIPAQEDDGVLVVVFSATGTTRGVAEKIAELTGADLAEIVPAQPYTEDDLKYSDKNSRSTKEQNDPDARPAISSDIKLDGYRTIYLGYPIWFGQAPRIMSTFVESHDFSGKNVIPFCTSGSSDIGKSDDTLAEQAKSGNWLEGKRFPGSVSEEELESWIIETGGMIVDSTLHMMIDKTGVEVDWESNAAVDALKKISRKEPLVIKMSMYGGFEQVGQIGQQLPADDKRVTAQPGDIMLYSGDQMVVFYGTNTWEYTRLGKIRDMDTTQLAELMARGDVTVTIVCGGK